MSAITDFLGRNADTLGNDLLSRLSGAVGGPELPPLQFSDPYQNNNAYVTERPAPPATQPETTPPPSRNWLMYGAIGIGAILVIGYLVKR